MPWVVPPVLPSQGMSQPWDHPPAQLLPLLHGQGVPKCCDQPQHRPGQVTPPIENGLLSSPFSPPPFSGCFWGFLGVSHSISPEIKLQTHSLSFSFLLVPS